MYNLYYFAMLLMSWDFDTLQTVAITVAAIAGLLWAWKSGIPALKAKEYKEVSEMRATQREDAVREQEKLKSQIEELEEENKLLRRECTQRMEINMQDQITIRELKEKLTKGA